MLSFNGSQYLITIYDIGKNTVIQKLAKGDIYDAGAVANAIVTEYYNSKTNGLMCSIIELTNDKVNLILKPNKIHGSLDRDLDKDIYVLQIYRYGDRPEFFITDEENEINKELNDVRSRNNTHYVLNKINYRGTHRINGNEEIRLNYTSYPGCNKKEFIEETAVIRI